MRGRGLVLGWVLVACGCATVDPSGDYASLATKVRERTGEELRTPSGAGDAAETERQVAARVRELLAEPLTADRAVAVALIASPRIQSMLEELGIAEADLVESGFIANPSLHAEVRFPARPQLPFEIDVAQELLSLLFRPMRVRVAEQALDAKQGELVQGVVASASAVERAFIEAQTAAQRASLRRAIVESTAAAATAAGKLRVAGNVTDLEVASEEALHEEARIALAETEGESRAKREAVNRSLGLWGPDVGWSLEPRLPDPPADDGPGGSLEAFAIENRTDLAALRHWIESRAQSAELARYMGWLEGLSVLGHYEHEPEPVGTVGPSLELVLPIFLQGQPEIARSDARLRQSLDEFAALAVEIRSTVRAARDRLEVARARAEHLRTAVIPLRQRMLEQTLRESYAMQASVFRLLEAKRAEIEAGEAYVQALSDYWLARVDLQEALGGRFPSDAEQAAANDVGPGRGEVRPLSTALSLTGDDSASPHPGPTETAPASATEMRGDP